MTTMPQTVIKTVEEEMFLFLGFPETLKQKKLNPQACSAVCQQSKESGVRDRRPISLRAVRTMQQDCLRKQTHSTHKVRKELGAREF